ncbi:MAG: hypothetical protein A4E19_10700 [Nitrospira sp. SG-bin1]|nr:MAG: hypothetical protein A4E19_10700 [Nitrospira sp. SG-bin1]
MTRLTAGSDHRTILIVDDNPAALYVKSRLLSRQGYRVIETNNGREALAMAAAERPDLILLDVNLPDIDGFDVCRQLKTQPETQFIKILQTSAARIGAPDRLRGLEVGADAYLIEPAEEEELIGTVEALLKLGQHERDNRRLIERLSESEARYRSLVERMPAAMYTIDRDGRITFYNEQAAELWGRRPNLRDREDRFCGSHRLFWPDGTLLPHDKTPMADAVQHGTVLHGQEIIIERPDGTRRHVIVHIDPLQNAEGHIIGAVNLFTDITARKRREDQLRESEERFALTHRATGIGTFEWRPDSGQVIWNRAHYELFGIDPSRPCSFELWRDAVHPDDLSRTLQAVQCVLDRGEGVIDSEYRIVRPDGDIRWMQGLGRLYSASEREPRRVIGICLDITDRKRAETALRRSEEEFRTISNAAPALVWVCNADGQIIYVNERWYEYTGQTREQAVGFGWAETLHPDDHARILTYWERCRAAGTTYEGECRYRRHDGAYRWHSFRALPRRDEQSRIEAWYGISIDIHVRKQAEEALRQSEEMLLLAQRSARAGVWDVDLVGGRVRWSEPYYELYGLSREVIPSQEGWIASIHPEDRARVEAEFANAIASRGAQRLEFRILRDREVRWLHSEGQVMCDANGRPVRVAGLTWDITERKRAEEQLRESHRFVSEMTGVLPGVLYVFDLRERRNVYVNRHTGKVLGYSAEEVHALGTEFIPSVLHPDDAPRLQQHLEYLKDLADGVTAQMEYRFRHRDGSYRWFLSRDVVWQRSAEGEVRQILGMATDITERKQAEEKLRESELRFRALVERIGDVFWISDPSSKTLLYVSQTFADIWGRHPRELYDHFGLWMDAIHEDDRPRVAAGFIERIYAGTYDMEYRVVRPDGSIRWIHDRGKPLGIGDLVAGVAEDITERKQAERALRESEERFRLLAEAMPHFVWQTDEQGQAEYENQRWYHYTGLTHATTGRGGWLTVQHPDDAPRLAEAWKKAVETGGEYDAETRFRRAVDGTYRWFRVRGAPVRDAEGRIQSWVGTCTDIHDRKETEAALRESETRFRNVFEHAGTGIAIATLDGSFVQCNPAYCAMLGYSEEEFRRLRFSELIHADDRADNLAEIERLLRAELPNFEIENRYVHKNGQPVWVHKFVSLLRDHAGEAKYLVALVTNVTERRKAEQALRETQARLQRWNVELEQAVNEKTAELRQSQDRLRTMTSELNLAEQRERKRLATELHDHLQQMLVVGKLTIGQGKRVTNSLPACEAVLKKVDDILSDALTYSRTLVAELSPPVLRDHGLAASLKWLAEYMKTKHTHTVTVAVPDDTELTLPEDQVILLFQSARELLINSAKHAGTGRATLRMDRRADQLRITVRDEGKGFEPAATAGTPSGELSSKFGLYSIEERMRALGGSFILESVPGHGTSATLMVPLTTNAKNQETTADDSPLISRRPHANGASQDPCLGDRPTIRVLLVDDHAMVRQGLRSVLDAYADIQVVGEARDGSEAVKLVEELRPRVVVMDINMPKMNGIEATEHIKLRYPDTMVIGISVNIGDGNSDAMRRAGAATLLTKEAAVEQLHETIVQAVGS